MPSTTTHRAAVRLCMAALIAAVPLTALWTFTSARAQTRPSPIGSMAPEFPENDGRSWLNTQPINLRELRGKVVLVEFWTFGCSNCRATLPWLKTMHERYSTKGLVIVGVHSPEFGFEREPAAVDPVLIDNDFKYWNAYNNRYWPAFYLVDGAGKIVSTRIGELHEGRVVTDQFEREIVRALGSSR
jgi:thiol-disulfide isomerase/thioredoxin